MLQVTQCRKLFHWILLDTGLQTCCKLPVQGQHSRQTTASGAYNQQTAAGEANQEPSLMEKAKAYIPVLGSSTDFDPASTGKPFHL